MPQFSFTSTKAVLLGLGAAILILPFALIHSRTPPQTPTPPSAMPVEPPSIQESPARFAKLESLLPLGTRLDQAFGLAVDEKGSLHIGLSGEHNAIARLGADTDVITEVGSLPGNRDGDVGEGRLNTPSALAYDHDGNLIIADTANHSIRRWRKDGRLETLAGNGHPGYRDGKAREAQFNGPVGIAVDHEGNILVADTYNDLIRKISRDGTVTTLAGGSGPGFTDGAASQARFDTPAGLAVTRDGNILIADTGNDAIRRLTPSGEVQTVARNSSDASADQLLDGPIAMVLDTDDTAFIVQEGNGRILTMNPNGQLQALQSTLPGYSNNRQQLRLHHPTAIAWDAKRRLLVSDPDVGRIYAITLLKQADTQFDAQSTASANRLPPEEEIIARALDSQHFDTHPWPVAPFDRPHEIVGVMGEIRGNSHGDSCDHLHSGLDIQAPMGATVYTIEAGKTDRVLSAWSPGSLSEGVRIGRLNYIHMLVGRTDKGRNLDSTKFQVDVRGDKHDTYVRIPRGTVFKRGAAIGSVNRMYHSHLDFFTYGVRINPFLLKLQGVTDSIPPVIEGVSVLAPDGKEIRVDAGNRYHVQRKQGPITIAVSGYDQIDGNQSRRRLGLYRLGLQVMNAQRQPLPAYTEMQWQMRFDVLPRERSACSDIYSARSGVTVHGSAKTEFEYQLSTQLIDGQLTVQQFDPAKLEPGQYILKVAATDFMGNRAHGKDEIQLSVE